MGALPGEKVRARIFRNDKNHSRADLLEVLEPSPDRTTPGCPLFGDCGGCQYQHLAYDKQLDWKTRQVEELMRHMAGIVHYQHGPIRTDEECLLIEFSWFDDPGAPSTGGKG